MALMRKAWTRRQWAHAGTAMVDRSARMVRAGANEARDVVGGTAHKAQVHSSRCEEALYSQKAFISARMPKSGFVVRAYVVSRV